MRLKRQRSERPKRLLEDGTAAPAVASLLRALSPAQPPSAAKEAELVRQLMTPVAVPPPSIVAAAGTPWIVGGVVVVACALCVSWLALRRTESASVPQTAAPHPVAVAPLPVAASPVPQAKALEPLVLPPVVPAPVRSSARDTLALEEALLEQARRSLASSPTSALSLLRQHQQRFPAGQLMAERMFLSVEARSRLGDRAGADRQAQALLKRFPSSVYAAQLRKSAQR